jgi:ATP-dependent helicase/nuclease subunit A
VSIPLRENFRSREPLLNFVNSFFRLTMTSAMGGVDYDDFAALRFGAPAERRQLSAEANPEPRVDLHVRVKRRATQVDDGADESEASDLQEADKEARLVALRLRELKDSRHAVWDEKTKTFRPVEWRDMAVLLRAPAGKVESYAREFWRLDVPLSVARTGFYSTLEVMDWLNLLQLLDNPLQDVPALAVLHSPLCGLSLEELARVRLALPKGHFWLALLKWHACAARKSEAEPDVRTFGKLDAFLKCFARWRRLARRVSLSQCFETALAETHYTEWLLAQPRGRQRHANLRRLAELVRRFDQFQRQSLFRFLQFVEAQQAAEAEPEVPAVVAENAVRLMSIHQSKGLEFPVVAIAALGKRFNLQDLRSEVILDEEYGLCPRIRPPHTGRTYPSLPHWLAAHRQHREILGEELRLLYVAMTRARDTLLLTASIGPKALSQWRDPGFSKPAASAATAADWLGLWFSRNCAAASEACKGQSALARWTIHEEDEISNAVPIAAETVSSLAQLDEKSAAALARRLNWQYPHAGAVMSPAKQSVTAIRRQVAEARDEEAVEFSSPRTVSGGNAPRNSRIEPVNPGGPGRSSANDKDEGRALGKAKLTASDIGLAHHKFLQFAALQRLDDANSVRAEAERLLSTRVLDQREAAFGRRRALYSGNWLLRRDLRYPNSRHCKASRQILQWRRNSSLCKASLTWWRFYPGNFGSWISRPTPWMQEPLLKKSASTSHK